VIEIGHNWFALALERTRQATEAICLPPGTPSTQMGRVVSTADSEGLVYTIRHRPRPK
jgi:hypothetical protein